MSSVSQANWRKWAIALILYTEDSSMTTEQLVNRLEADGWKVLPQHGRTESISRTLTADMRKHGIWSFFTKTKVGRRVYWNLNAVGRRWTAEYLLLNHNITPQISQEEF